MPPRPSTSVSSAFARLSLSRGLQTTAPLPPPTTPLPPSDIPPPLPLQQLWPISHPSSHPLPYPSQARRPKPSPKSPRNPPPNPGDTPGTTLSLSKILEVGSRDYALRSQASNASILKRNMDWKEKRLSSFSGIPEGLVHCDLTILEHTKSPLERILKKKRRKGYKKTIEHKQGYTRLRVGDILLKGENAEI
ncbi:hypothetical protein I302_101307 [Kwoniella bestiolae CBS 10118]|uniref:Large ribosomal subunit protein bL21m n=1 Tax=Kwoniella bestiolae CBS 10118 TaxID=1296100 RepID=A0AAJ8K1F0_9TREE